MSDAVTLNELRELPASAIQALPRATHIVSGDTTIGILIPVKKPSPEAMAALFAEAEVVGRAGSLGARATVALKVTAELLAGIMVAEEEVYADLLDRAAETLRLAPASRNGSTADAHVLALAWTLNADIWSHDRDFAGTGRPSWSSANLRAALAGP